MLLRNPHRPKRRSAARRRSESKRWPRSNGALRVMTKAMRNLLELQDRKWNRVSGGYHARYSAVGRDKRAASSDAAAALWLEATKPPVRDSGGNPDEGEYQWMEANR